MTGILFHRQERWLGLFRNFVRRMWFYGDGDGLADPKRDRRFSGNFDAHGVTLREPDPINGLINRRQQTGGSSAGTILHKDSPSDALYRSFKRFIMVAHQRHFHGSAGSDRDELSFLEVSGDPERARINQGEELITNV